jgi:hypothetical protein
VIKRSSPLETTGTYIRKYHCCYNLTLIISQPVTWLAATARSPHTTTGACADYPALKKPAGAGDDEPTGSSYLETSRFIKPRFWTIVRCHALLTWFAETEYEESIFISHYFL